MPLVLSATAGSPPCRTVFMVKELLNLNMEMVEVAPMKGDLLKPEFMEKNPVHTIPFLEDGDLGLVDSHAIVTYLVSKYGAEKKATLYPGELSVRAKVDQILFLDASTLFPRFINAFRPVLMQKLKACPEEDVKKIEEAYGFLEKYLEKSEYLSADHVTVADIACVATVSTLHAMVPIGEQYPNVHRWWNKLKQEDWYEKGNVEGLALITGLWNNFVSA